MLQMRAVTDLQVIIIGAENCRDNVGRLAYAPLSDENENDPLRED